MPPFHCNTASFELERKTLNKSVASLTTSSSFVCSKHNILQKIHIILSCNAENEIMNRRSSYVTEKFLVFHLCSINPA